MPARQQLLDVQIALGMAAARGRWCGRVHRPSPAAAGARAARRGPSPRRPGPCTRFALRGSTSRPRQQGLGLGPAVGLDDADGDVVPRRPAGARARAASRRSCRRRAPCRERSSEAAPGCFLARRSSSASGEGLAARFARCFHTPCPRVGPSLAGAWPGRRDLSRARLAPEHVDARAGRRSPSRGRSVASAIARPTSSSGMPRAAATRAACDGRWPARCPDRGRHRTWSRRRPGPGRDLLASS